MNFTRSLDNSLRGLDLRLMVSLSAELTECNDWALVSEMLSSACARDGLFLDRLMASGEFAGFFFCNNVDQDENYVTRSFSVTKHLVESLNKILCILLNASCSYYTLYSRDITLYAYLSDKVVRQSKYLLPLPTTTYTYIVLTCASIHGKILFIKTFFKIYILK